MATNMNLEKLAILDLSYSRITENWEGWNQIKVGDNLEVLDLTRCRIHRTMDLSQFRNLTRLILEQCYLLTEIDSSIGKLKSLKHLNLKGCLRLRGLPIEIGSLGALEEIFLQNHWALNPLPESIGNLKSLVILEVHVAGLDRLPHTIGNLRKLKRLSLRECSIHCLPETLGGIHSLIELDLSGTDINGLPDSLGGLKKLKRLSLRDCYYIKKLPDSLGDLNSLSELDISCSGLTELPDSVGDLKELKVIKMAACHVHKLPRSVGKMKKLEQLDARGSSLKGEIPNEIGMLSSMERLELSCTKTRMLPSTINQLSVLKALWLKECDELEELPVLPTSLVSLNFTSVLLKRVPDLSALSNLTDLVLNNVDGRRFPRRTESDPWLGFMGEKRARLPSDKNRSEFKKILQFCISDVNKLPAGILGFFPELESLELGCPELLCLPQLPLSLSKLVLKYLKMDMELTCLSNMKKLSNLTLFRCAIGEDGFKSLRIGDLEHLKSLRVEADHRRLNGLSLPVSLQFLHLISCTCAKNLPDVSHLKSLQGLRIHKCEELSEVPGLGNLESLRELSIGYCDSWKRMGFRLPVSLKELLVYYCSCLEELPNLSPFKNLEVLRTHYCKGLLAIQGLGRLESLEELVISDCESLKTIGPHVPVNLKRLRVSSCTFLRKLPDLSCSKKLQKLQIWSCNGLVKIAGLGEMESLQKLSLLMCRSLKSLGPQLPVSLQILRIISCDRLKRLPNVSHLKNLEELSTSGSDVEIPGREELKLLKTDDDFKSMLCALMGG